MCDRQQLRLEGFIIISKFLGIQQSTNSLDSSDLQLLFLEVEDNVEEEDMSNSRQRHGGVHQGSIIGLLCIKMNSQSKSTMDFLGEVQSGPRPEPEAELLKMCPHWSTSGKRKVFLVVLWLINTEIQLVQIVYRVLSTAEVDFLFYKTPSMLQLFLAEGARLNVKKKISSASV